MSTRVQTSSKPSRYSESEPLVPFARRYELDQERKREFGHPSRSVRAMVISTSPKGDGRGKELDVLWQIKDMLDCAP